MKIAVVIISCDKYSDLWKPFLHQFRLHWPDCPFPVYLTSNFNDEKFPGVQTLPVGEDRSWSDNLLKALATVQEDYVLMYIEDLFLVEAVQGPLLAKALAWAEQHRPNHLRLNCTEPPTRRCDDLVGELEPGAPYRTSTVLSLWNKAALVQLLLPGENAWQFEIRGSQRSDSMDRFYSLYQDCFPVLNGVIKGKWTREAVARLAAQGAPLQLEARAVMSVREAARFQFHTFRSKIFKLVPWRFRRRLRSWFLKV